MNSHENARLTPHSRAEVVRRVLEDRQPTGLVADAFGVSITTVRKWVGRYRREGPAGLRDRSSRPHRFRAATPAGTVRRVESMRRYRWTGRRIALELDLSPATVSRILNRLGLSRMRDLEPPEPVRRYEREQPGELIHLDTKKLGRFDKIGHRITGNRKGQSKSRGIGWEFVHVAIDDHSRVSVTGIYPDEKAASAVQALKTAVRYYESLGITVQRVMTDNGSCYKAHAFKRACAELGIKQIKTKPYTPKTNGKAERFIKTAINEWAYARAYPNSRRRAEDLPRWTHDYNWHRPHGGIGSIPPIQRIPNIRNNLLRVHI